MDPQHLIKFILVFPFQLKNSKKKFMLYNISITLWSPLKCKRLRCDIRSIYPNLEYYGIVYGKEGRQLFLGLSQGAETSCVCVCTKRVCVKFTVLFCKAIRLAFSCQTSAISFLFIPIPWFESHLQRKLYSRSRFKIEQETKIIYNFI